MDNIKMLNRSHQKAANRLRRSIFQFDIFGRLNLNSDEITIEHFMKQLFEYIDSVPHQIDSIYWDMMYNGDEYSVYPSDFMPQRSLGPMSHFIKAGIDLFKVMTEKGRQLGVENILVHRISEVDVHQGNPHKKEHPEMYIKSWLWSGTHNLAVPEIRERKLRIFKECMAKYPFDGLEIDFCRHTPFLPPGQQWELRDNVTEFMRMNRAMLLELEEKLRRPLLLSARIPETLNGCRIDGIDVEQWAKERLVDSLTLGSRNFNVDLEEFHHITKGKGIKIYPCFDAHHTVDGYANPPIEVYRSVFSNWWDRGADGVKLFNWHTASCETYDKSVACYPNCQEQALSEIGDPEIMRFKNKTFVLERKGGYPWGEGYANHNLTKPLPLTIPNCGAEKEMEIYICDPISKLRDKISCLSMNIITYGLNKGDQLKIRINGFEFEGIYSYEWDDILIRAPEAAPISGKGCHNLPSRKGGPLQCLHIIPDCGAFIKGFNIIEASLVRNSKYSYYEKVTLEKLEIKIEYK